MTSSVRRSAGVLAAWTALVWGLRTRNIIIDNDITAGAVTPVACFLVGAAVLVGLVLTSRANLTRPWAGAGSAVALFGIVYWVVRSIEIAFDDHSVAFIVVHAVLGGVTTLLSLWLLRTVRAWWNGPGIAAGGYGLTGAVE